VLKQGGVVITAKHAEQHGKAFPERTEDVIARLKDAPEPRLREVMTLLIRHLHAFVREAALTQDEWFNAIQFFTRAGLRRKRRQPTGSTARLRTVRGRTFSNLRLQEKGHRD
jgi:catechol 2,3-dioxygenase-like protein